jgi:tetratricopeptide (TPR) repeat protein
VPAQCQTDKVLLFCNEWGNFGIFPCNLYNLAAAMVFIGIIMFIAHGGRGVFMRTAPFAGCETDSNGVASLAPSQTPVASAVSETPPATYTVQDPTDVKYYPSDEPLKLALEHFNRGHFGIAAKYFEDAVAKAPRDATAWVGLAASYDRIGRFDLADRAYKQAIKLVGETTAILNNEGYSYMLRGRLVEARRKLLKAYEREPQNPTIVNNLELLNSSERVIRRD